MEGSDGDVEAHIDAVEVDVLFVVVITGSVTLRAIYRAFINAISPPYLLHDVASRRKSQAFRDLEYRLEPQPLCIKGAG